MVKSYKFWFENDSFKIKYVYKGCKYSFYSFMRTHFTFNLVLRVHSVVLHQIFMDSKVIVQYLKRLSSVPVEVVDFQTGQNHRNTFRLKLKLK